MPIKEEWIRSKKPATQGDLSELQEDTHYELDQSEQRMKKFIKAEIMASEKRTLKIVATKKDLEEFVKRDDLQEFKNEIVYEFKAGARDIKQSFKETVEKQEEEMKWIKDMIKAIVRHVGLPMR